MIIRHATLYGTVPAKHQPAFDAHMAGPVIAAMQQYPNIVKVELEKITEQGTETPPIYLQFNSYYATLEDMNAALASPVRDTVKVLTQQGLKQFDGYMTHSVSQLLTP
ncbi:hypothetical protein [Amylibacter sp. IMCC11727]|uniref:hypothetical protein n=1 Tax=Amylibacter sp. IMCC11727 TaxID=3039851 RepID=UPI00244E16C7|nr:hypothetical protein [Amylibacter sp. IMCC11727]WGI21414.1 hypothetical protein QBD29_15040 [Amylibacter sp. IMCC11727]